MSSKITQHESKHAKLLITKTRAALVLTKFQLSGLKMAFEKLNKSSDPTRGNYSAAASELRQLCDRKTGNSGELLDLFHLLRNVNYKDE